MIEGWFGPALVGPQGPVLFQAPDVAMPRAALCTIVVMVNAAHLLWQSRT